jgi:hypothetical protein
LEIINNECVAPKNTAENNVISEFNNAANWNTPLPYLMQSKTSCSLHPYAYFANKFVVIWVAVSAVNIPVFSSANEARMSSASSNTKLDVRYNGPDALNIVFFLTDCVWLGFRNQILNYSVYNIIPTPTLPKEGAEIGKLIIKIVSLTITGSFGVRASFKTTL